MNKDASISFVVGMRGMGKTSQAKHIVKDRAHPVIAIDPNDEWASVLKVQAEHSLKGMASRMRRYWRSPFRAVYVPPPGNEALALHHLCGMLVQLQRGYKLGQHNRQITLLVEEANLSYPSANLPSDCQAFTHAILQGRHWGINIVAITQRPQLVHPNLRGNASETYCLPLADDRARAAVLEVVGSQHRQALQSLQRFEYIRFAFGGAERGEVKP